MTLLGIGHRHQVILVIVAVIIPAFMLIARLDFVYIPRESFAQYTVNLGFITLHEAWFWMSIGFILLAVGSSLIYLFGASDTERNMWYAFGVFVTVILFAVGQLEDFFYQVINPEVSWLPASQDWSPYGWSAETSLCWRLFGTWNSDLHLIWLTGFLVVVVVMWALIWEYA